MTSNSSNFTLNAVELLTSAFEMIGVAKAGEPLDDEDAQPGYVTLNVMLKAMQKKLNIWKRKTFTITLVAGQYLYTIGQKSKGTTTSTSANNLVDTAANFNRDNIQVGDTVFNTTDGTSTTVSGVTSITQLALATDIFTSGESYELTNADVSAPRPQIIVDCNRKNSTGNEVKMNPLTRRGYEDLPNKTSPGPPISFHYDPSLTNGTMYIWQAPDAAAVAEWSVEVVSQQPIEDIDAATDEFDVPAENYEALIIGLAYRLSWRFGGLTASERRDLKADAKDAMELAEGYEQNQDGDVQIYPEIESESVYW